MGIFIRKRDSKLSSEMKMVKSDWKALMDDVSYETKNNPDVILEAVVHQNYMAMMHASESLRKDRAFVHKVVVTHQVWQALAHVHPDLKNSDDGSDLMLQAIGIHWKAFDLVTDELRSDAEFVRQAVQRNWELLKLPSCPHSIKMDREIWLEAAEQDAVAMELVPEALRISESFALAAFAKNPSSLPEEDKLVAHIWLRQQHGVGIETSTTIKTEGKLFENWSDSVEAPLLSTRRTEDLLHYACQKGFHRAVLVLLRCDTTQSNEELLATTSGEFDFTPLLWASAEGHPLVCQTLLLYGANPKVTDNRNYGPKAVANRAISLLLPGMDHDDEKKKSYQRVLELLVPATTTRFDIAATGVGRIDAYQRALRDERLVSHVEWSTCPLRTTMAWILGVEHSVLVITLQEEFVVDDDGEDDVGSKYFLEKVDSKQGNTLKISNWDDKCYRQNSFQVHATACSAELRTTGLRMLDIINECENNMPTVYDVGTSNCHHLARQVFVFCLHEDSMKRTSVTLPNRWLSNTAWFFGKSPMASGDCERRSSAERPKSTQMLSEDRFCAWVHKLSSLYACADAVVAFYRKRIFDELGLGFPLILHQGATGIYQMWTGITTVLFAGVASGGGVLIPPFRAGLGKDNIEGAVYEFACGFLFLVEGGVNSACAMTRTLGVVEPELLILTVPASYLLQWAARNIDNVRTYICDEKEVKKMLRRRSK